MTGIGKDALQMVGRAQERIDRPLVALGVSNHQQPGMVGIGGRRGVGRLVRLLPACRMGEMDKG